LIDNQLIIGSDHHQKAVFIRKSSLPFLFIGGMDITNDRLNWIDAQVEIIGSGALLGLNTLEERWKSVESPFIKSIKPFVNYNVPQILKNSGFTVQFIRTYSPIQVGNEKIANRNYAENGDFTYFNLVRKALLNCRKSIYQEDQFFEVMGNIPQPIESPQSPNNIKRSNISGTSLDPLIYSKAGQQNFKYFGIGNNYFNTAFPRYFGNNKFNSSNNNSFPVLMQLGSDFFKLTNVFFHSKLWIFDDELIIIGSANYWNPSFNSEPRPGFQKNEGDIIKSEFGVAFTSSKATGEIFGFPKVSYIHGLRLKLWERIRQFAEPAFHFKPDQVGDFENEFNVFVRDFDDKGTKRNFFIPMR
jgi:phosphatidylserine/phosphatidylglycerophosphate/cardiolipin synthase-like enzyme